MSYLRSIFFSLVLFILAIHSAYGQSSTSGDHVTVSWLAPETFAAGEPVTLGFYFEVDPEWHVYWQNAGDSGAAPRFAFTANGAEIGPIQWPFPRRLPIEHLTNFGYEGNVAYLFELTPDAQATMVSINVELEWLVCKIDCIPGFGSLSLERPVADSAQWREQARERVEQFQQRIPQTAASSPWQATALLEDSDQTLRLTLTGPTPAPEVFPLDGNLFTGAAPALATDGDSLHYTFKRTPGASLPATSDFVISDGEQAWQLDQVALGSAPPPASAPQALWLLLLGAFVGGIILNLMPCVFPVLSIKLFSLINHQNSAHSGNIREGLLYSAGVITTFAALGALLLALRAGGAAIGWGFQLQSAPVVLALIILFWFMALAFSGVFDFGHRLMNMAGNAKGGSFSTGVLAVFVAAPCTGPFMGVALGAAAVLPAASAMAIFIGLGAGLAAPFMLLAASPALLQRLPKPGPWMDRLRQLLAFPLYATVIWLLWVLGRLLGDSGWLLGSSVLLALVFALWLGQNLGRAGKAIAIILALLTLILAFGATTRTPADVTASSDGLWQAYDRQLIATARAENRPVFIDYTAAWCITCQVNKARVLDTARITELFETHNVLAIRADWTRHDAAITEALAELGRNSVPVYAWYAPGEEAQLLPQLLTERMITDLL
ncbi:MAG TPA: protein-disulfide reductase DsbD domain-containing protein [Cellvibrionaceae bacterium]